ncbi:hypothetical protein B9479_002836 [Cryptococcus floricola]|uniref:Ketoreductase (KR) domain-containing protein n=1 Tax=Cryptococcus floricola TaxID=2591691 RepID=A0A5D3B2J8_9TREE|nr:hypothetical protein B9479_002836 [Cryptococcus floricola]
MRTNMGVFANLAHSWNHFVTHGGSPMIFWMRPNWSVDQMPDQSGKTVLITGGNSGVGYASALALYNANANVSIACRSHARAQEAAEDIKKNGDGGIWGVRYNQRTPAEESKLGSIDVLTLDLSDLIVKQAAEEYKLHVLKLDLLYLNAGILAARDTLRFGSMVLGHQRLTTHLPSSHPPFAPVGIRESDRPLLGWARPGGINYLSVVRHPDDVATPDGSPKRGKNELDRWTEYGQTKWATIAMAKYLANVVDEVGTL